MIIQKAQEEDLETILELQYLAYQSEAKLFPDFVIPPLTQTLDEVVVLKAVDEKNTIIGSVRACLEKGTVYIGKLMDNLSLYFLGWFQYNDQQI